MAQKIVDVLPESYIKGFSKKKIAIINTAIKSKMPILFIGEGRTGKTSAARILQRAGIIAYAPEDVLLINLGNKEVVENG